MEEFIFWSASKMRKCRNMTQLLREMNGRCDPKCFSLFILSTIWFSPASSSQSRCIQNWAVWGQHGCQVVWGVHNHFQWGAITAKRQYWSRMKSCCFDFWHVNFFPKQNKTSFIRDQCCHLADDGSPLGSIRCKHTAFDGGTYPRWKTPVLLETKKASLWSKRNRLFPGTVLLLPMMWWSPITFCMTPCS